MEYPIYDSKQENSKYNILSGLVIDVDTTSQTMTVSTSFGVFSKIAINNDVALNGCGIRVTPVPMLSRVLLYNQNSELFHIGSFYSKKSSDNSDSGLVDYTNTQDYSKEVSKERLLMRNLEPGEVSLQGFNNSEIFLPLNGDILLLNSSFSSLLLDSETNTIQSKSEAVINSTPNVSFYCGKVHRNINGSAKELSGMVMTTSGVVGDNDVQDGAVSRDLFEFGVDIGTTVNPSTGEYDSDSNYTISSFRLANVVVDNTGSPVTHNGAPLYAHLDIKPIDVKFICDHSGVVSFFGTNPENPQQELTLNFGASPEFKMKIKNTELTLGNSDNVDIHSSQYHLSIKANGDLEYSSNFVKFKIMSDGSFSLMKTNADNEELAIFKCDAENNMTLKTTNSITLLSNGEDQAQKTVLGEVLKTVLGDISTALQTHIHPSAVGPTGASPGFTQFTPQYFEQILSEKTRNN